MFDVSVRSGAIRNVESARVSIIGQLKKILSEDKDTDKNETSAFNIGNQSHAVMQTEIAEEAEETEEPITNEDVTSSSNFDFKPPNVFSFNL